MFNSRREALLDSLSFLIIDLSGLQSMDMLATKKKLNISQVAKVC